MLGSQGQARAGDVALRASVFRVGVASGHWQVLCSTHLPGGAAYNLSLTFTVLLLRVGRGQD